MANIDPVMADKILNEIVDKYDCILASVETVKKLVSIRLRRGDVTVSMDDVIGMEGVKVALRDAVVLPAMRPEVS
jgi:hypothetical protein